MVKDFFMEGWQGRFVSEFELCKNSIRCEQLGILERNH